MSEQLGLWCSNAQRWGEAGGEAGLKRGVSCLRCPSIHHRDVKKRAGCWSLLAAGLRFEAVENKEGHWRRKRLPKFGTVMLEPPLSTLRCCLGPGWTWVDLGAGDRPSGSWGVCSFSVSGSATGLSSSTRPLRWGDLVASSSLAWVSKASGSVWAEACHTHPDEMASFC